jgi:hypothetical protein
MVVANLNGYAYMHRLWVQLELLQHWEPCQTHLLQHWEPCQTHLLLGETT